jgi:hypothetical protein
MPDQTPGWGPPPNRPPQPGWGPPSPQPPRRRPGVVGWVAIGLGVLVVLAVIGSLSNDRPTATPQPDAAAASDTVTQPPLTEPPTTEVVTTAAPTTEPPATAAPTTTYRTPPATHAAPTTHRPPTTRPAPKTTRAPSGNCDPSYPDSCLHDGIGDYDCAGGSGNGPNYVDGPIRVRPPDPFDLDRDGDGLGCED